MEEAVDFAIATAAARAIWKRLPPSLPPRRPNPTAITQKTGRPTSRPFLVLTRILVVIPNALGGFDVGFGDGTIHIAQDRVLRAIAVDIAAVFFDGGVDAVINGLGK